MPGSQTNWSETDIRKLYNRMKERGVFFFPTGAVFVNASREKLNAFKKTGLSGNDSDSEDHHVWTVYAEWHEAVHMMQLVTSPYILPRAALLAGIAEQAMDLDWQDEKVLLPLRDQYKKIMGELESPSSTGLSPLHIIEAQAVVLGLLWTFNGTDADSLLWLANRWYKDDPLYIKVLNYVTENVGAAHAFELIPRFCHFALQRQNPSTSLTTLIQSFIDVPDRELLLESSPSELCQWAGAKFGDATLQCGARTNRQFAALELEFVTSSLRERVPVIMNTSWIRQFRHYFDDFEKISCREQRWRVLTGSSGPDTFRMFKPWVTIFADCFIYSAIITRCSEDEQYSRVRTTLDYIEALSVVAGS